MKKMIIALASVALAIGVQAATVSWTINNVTGPDGSLLSGGSVYLFVSAGSSADTTWVAGMANKGAEFVSGKMNDAAFHYDMSGSTAPLGNYSYIPGNGFTLKTNAEMGMSGSTTYTLYAVIFDTATITDASQFYVTGVKSAATYADSVNNNRGYILSAASSATASNWHVVADVPEPTSGLLLLVGGALLALRRKQK